MRDRDSPIVVFYPLDENGLCLYHHRRHHPGKGCPTALAKARRKAREAEREETRHD